jgi:hypothetical protein
VRKVAWNRVATWIDGALHGRARQAFVAIAAAKARRFLVAGLKA